MNIIILIPSYKRSIVLDSTLKGLLDNHEPTHNIKICVGDNKTSIESETIIKSYVDKFKEKNIEFLYKLHPENIGKAECLNDLYNSFYKKEDIIVTMDNDMVIKKPWYHFFDAFLSLDYDLLGVASKTFWMHLPEKSKCRSSNFDRYILLQPAGIAGGILLLKPSFLAQYLWSNHGGVYGEDDAGMVAKTWNRGVLDWQEDWLDHDPLMGSTPELEQYKNKKIELLNKKQYIFQKGWDE